MFAVSLCGSDREALGVARFHAENGILETGNHHLVANCEFDGVAVAAGVENSSVIQGAGIVDAHLVAVLRCHCPAFLLRKSSGRQTKKAFSYIPKAPGSSTEND